MGDDDLETKSVRLPHGVWKSVNVLRHDLRLKSEAEAMRRIVVAGIQAIRAAGDVLNRDN